VEMKLIAALTTSMLTIGGAGAHGMSEEDIPKITKLAP
jgi:hypothetical protein